MKKLSPTKRLWRLLKLYKPEIRLIYVYALFIGLVNLSLPLGIQAIINFLQTGAVSSSWLILVLLVLLGITVTGILQVLQLRLVENIQQDLFARSAFEFAFRLPQIESKELDSIHAPELANRFFDTLTIQKGLPKLLIDFSLSTFQILFGMLLLAIYSVYFLLIGIVLVLALLLLVRLTGRQGLETSLIESKYKYNLAFWLEEIGRVRRTFFMSQPKSFHLDKSDDITYDYVTSRETHFKVLMMQFKSFIGFKVFMAAGILVIGGLLVFNQQMNIGQFVAAEIVIILIINSTEKLLRVWDTVYDVLTGLDKIGFVTDLELSKDTGAETLQAQKVDITIRDLEFTHIGHSSSTFEGLNAQIPSGAKVVLSGKTGSGKSTLLKILSGILPPSSGEILLNGIPMKEINQASVFENIGMVFAANQIFEGTIRENILMGRALPEAQLQETLQRLGLADYISDQPKGIHSLMDSGGRRTPRCIIQKIHLARAIVHQPNILLMEDPLINIPQAERRSIIQYLTAEDKPWTLVVISDEEDWLAESSMTLTL